MSFASPASTPRLNRRADRHDFVRVDAAVWLFAPELLLDVLATAASRVEPPTRTTSSILPGSSPESLSAALHGADSLLDQVGDELLQLAPGVSGDREVLRAGRVGGDERGG